MTNQANISLDELEVIQADRDALNEVFSISLLMSMRGQRDDEPFLQILARHRLAALTEARAKALEEAAEVAVSFVGKAKRDRIARGWKMSRYQPHERDEIAAEENGGNIAAEEIATAIRALKDQPPPIKEQA